MLPFSVRQFLRTKKALLVHFNTPMQTNHSHGYPSDLWNAKTLSGKELSFSTIQIGDKGPWQVQNPADGNAGGSVGIVVDVQDIGSVCSVYPEDSGSSDFGSAGKTPDLVTCEESIVKRITNNEWRVKDYKVLGIFVFLPCRVFINHGSQFSEVEHGFGEVIINFPNDRIFSTLFNRFIEYNRIIEQWQDVTYDEIVPQ